MKQLFKRIACLVALGMVLALSAPFAALAAEAPYTYTVTLSMGRQGSYSGTGVQVLVTAGTGTPVVSATNEKLTISGLPKGARVTLDQIAANVDPDGKYYVKGVRLSGRDNNTYVTAPSFAVTEDAEYVMAYGIKGDLTQYTVNYQDANGNALAPSRSYYGNVGDKPVVAYLYIDGYQPQSYNLTKTLAANSAENVFTFVYGRAANGTGGSGDNGGGGSGGGGSGGGSGGGGTGTGGDTGTGTTPPPQEIIIYIPAPVTPVRPTARPTTGNGGSNDDGNNENTDNNGENADENAEENADGEGESEPEEIVQEVPAPDQNAANGANGNGANGANGGTGDEAAGSGTPEELTDIDANRTPLANLIHQIAQTVSNASPVALAGGGIVVAGLVGLLFFLLLARKKKKDEEEKSDEHSRH